VAGTKRVVAPPRRPNDPTGAFGNLGIFSLFLAGLYSEYISFSHSSSSSGAVTTICIAAPTTSTTTTEATIRVTPGPVIGGEPQTPKGVLEDVMEEFEEEPRMAPELAPEVVPEEVLVEGAMITVRAVAPSPSHDTPASFSPAPRIAAAKGAASSAVLEVVLGHPTPYALDDIRLGETVSTAHRALTQV
jgi:hypothetical protein